MKLFKTFVISYLLLVTQSTFAYEIDTHARITQHAYLRSVLATDAGLLADFGIRGIENFGDNYFDVSDADIVLRNSFPFEDRKITRAGAIPATIQGWLMRGAIREDDCSSLSVFFGLCGNPTDDPVNSDRPLNHFFDPVNNEALSIFADTAPNWTLGTLNAFTTPIQPLPDNLIKTNHFTMFDAREAQYRALTGHTKEGTKDIYPTDGSPQPTEPLARAAYWATLFRTMGDMVHLVQDMSQPQHTSNHAHVGDSYGAYRGAFWPHPTEENAYV